MKSKRIVTALASFGMSGRVFHAPFLERSEDYELKLILERSKALSSVKYPDTAIIRSFQEIVEDYEVTLVIVNTPTYLHYQMCKQALLAGKNVVVEKPFTSTVAEGEELISIAKDKGLILTVYHNKRLEGDMKTVKKLIENGSFGELKSFKLALHRFRPDLGPKKWKEEKNPGAGLLYDIGSHMIDIALQFFGKPESINADLQIQRSGGQVVDYFSIDMNYDGFIVNLFSDMLTEEILPSLVVEGSKGRFVKYGHDPQEVNLSKEVIGWNDLGLDNPANYGSLVSVGSGISEVIKTKNGSYVDFYCNLAKIIRGDANLLVTAEEGLEVVKVIEELSLKFPIQSSK